ncbi:XrtA/PEP-CTERM system-associated ATPase [Methylovulum psychrotolerans]|uniref:ATPase n=1 Tax=Methylovulum psychrotolerans TaxID=1704499 RepID=A0A1Z4BUN5_9GAMM|nr:XrtA/PEP-CTERM system-associated ATPase [Methylovulum psychrotolerans]ASF45024.1 ATPase [Methylovulum psychrotolerans]MBT9096932.1 XrtA-associated ATPase [Methylovulum psychrotolerans]POZ51121.1 ATPase [Methylovulum psychrotolerans]
MYDGFYKLTRKPFQLNSDNDFFFKSEVHKRALAYMRYGLTQGEGFIVITGTPGTGKTMLIKQLLGSINPQKVTYGVIVSAQVGAEDILKVVAAALNLSYQEDDKATLLGKLEQFFAAEAAQGKRVLLIVDEAQNLPKNSLEELRMLANFERGGKTLLQLFLLGQNQFNKTLAQSDMEQFRQRVVATYQLKPLDEEQVKNYILFRLKRAGWQQSPHFSDVAFEEIFAHSKGIPRKINTLCERIMMLGFLDELQVIDQAVVQTVLADIAEEELDDGEVGALPANVNAAIAGSLEARVARLENLLADLHKVLAAYQPLPEE